MLLLLLMVGLGDFGNVLMGAAFAAGGWAAGCAESAGAGTGLGGTGVAGRVFAAVDAASAATSSVVDARCCACRVCSDASPVMGCCCCCCCCCGCGCGFVFLVPEHLVGGEADGHADAGEVGRDVASRFGGADFAAGEGGGAAGADTVHFEGGAVFGGFLGGSGARVEGLGAVTPYGCFLFAHQGDVGGWY